MGEAGFNFADPKGIETMLEGERSIQEEISRSLSNRANMTDDMALELEQEASKSVRIIQHLEHFVLEHYDVEAA